MLSGCEFPNLLFHESKTNKTDFASQELLPRMSSTLVQGVEHQFANLDFQGEYAYHQSVIDNARAAEKAQPGRQIAIALDTKGPVREYPILKKASKEEEAEHKKRKSGPVTPLVMPICPLRLAPS